MQKLSVFLKIKIHFVLYYKYYSYLCNTEKEINGKVWKTLPFLLLLWLNV